ncbi:hypothetical protein GCM10009551_061350 [Nocardiopsis tropica]|uniref:hypothetical protein n=1 Tax=Tsukamurella strandjordii TaxID=147577 RepID=UPI0031DE16C2
MGTSEGRTWLPASTVAGAAVVSPIVAFVLLWQVRDKLNAVYMKAQSGPVTVPDDMAGQAIRFIVVAVVVALIGLVAAGGARALSSAARVALIGCGGALLVHAAVLAPDVWLHDMSIGYASYAGFMIGEILLFVVAVIAELYVLVSHVVADRVA